MIAEVRVGVGCESGAPVMTIDDRKAAVTAYKERKVTPGIYAVRCTPTNQAWGI